MIFSLNIVSPSSMKLILTGSTSSLFLTSSLSPSAVSNLTMSFSVVMITLGDGMLANVSLMCCMSLCLNTW